MRITTAQTDSAWLSGDYEGLNRPMQRALISELTVFLRGAAGGRKYTSAIYGQPGVPKELPNIKSINWDRSVDSDAATMTMVLYNTEPLPLGTIPERDYELGLPGYYTFNRGATVWSQSRWQHTSNAWQGLLVPDRVIRTYEGYGFDATVAPHADPHMYSSGIWKIDDVQYGTDGLITVQARDLASLLIDQHMHPPVVPREIYPLEFTPQTLSASDPPPTGSTLSTPALSGSSSGTNAGAAFDADPATYWESPGSAAPDHGSSFEWIEATVPAGGQLGQVRFLVSGGPYTVYVSVMVDGLWQGEEVSESMIPYKPLEDPNGDNGSAVRFLDFRNVPPDSWGSWTPVTPVVGATKVRLTFTNLFKVGTDYRARLSTFQIATGTKIVTSGGVQTEGNYGDYSDIVKLLCAFAGFWWPSNAAEAYYKRPDGSSYVLPAPNDDTYLGKGKVWGDIEMSGTRGPAPLNAGIWDKKPVMDGISYVRDVLGFNFYVDEDGAAIFRSPNIWSRGNFLLDVDGQYSARTTSMVEIDERVTLMGLRATLSSRNVRERVFVGDALGKIGAASAGYNPYPSGMRRVSIWTDQNFKDGVEGEKEARIMADLITLRQLFTFRTDRLTIPGNPAIQIDDQVQIWESITGEGYVHYVKGVSSSWDLESGKWAYDLDTHWLGEVPFTDWVFDPATLHADTQEWLKTIGRLPP